MAGITSHSLAKAVWEVARRQHGVVARWQLLELGASRAWVEHRISKGRLDPVHRGVYAVGARDNRRMQQHALAGRTAVRFSHYEVRYESGRVEAAMKALAMRLRRAA